MLEVRGLKVSYGERLVIDGLDLTVASGEVVGLVGPNGCGKTTLLRAVTGLAPTLAGEMLIGGSPASELSARQLARTVAVVPQTATLPVGYTAAEVVLMGRTAHLGFFEQEGPDDYRRAREALGRVGALALLDRPVDELSGGERQNVLLARALAQAPRLLLLDEPTANLDIGYQACVAALMRELARDDGIAVLATVHDLTLASLYCDRIALMANGRVLVDGAPSEVLTQANIRAAYGSDVVVLERPRLPGPVVLPWSADGLESALQDTKQAAGSSDS
jgi:iron complex transport system ATP-binding protein